MQFMYNPGFAGAGGARSLNLSAFSFLPGNGFGLRSVYASYDGYYDGLHGGAGVWLSDDMPGEVMNDLRGGVSYAYHFRAGRDVYITSGLTASVISRGIRRGSIILPDDIDPLRGITGAGIEYASPSAITRFDLGIGFTIASGPWYGGASVMHLTRPPLSIEDQENNRIDRLYALTGGVELTPWGEDLSLMPSATFLAQGDEIKIYLGSEASWKGLMASLAMWHVSGGFTAAGYSIGWDASYVKIIISYSYILTGGSASIGGTAIVKAGAAFAFGNVEKSRAIHIIKLPLL
jgi:type IX secretion system PorP/SprF family membrane protein